jgi:hypothetical protein
MDDRGPGFLGTVIAGVGEVEVDVSLIDVVQLNGGWPTSAII